MAALVNIERQAPEMSAEVLRQASELSERGITLVATSDGDGLPDVAVSGRLREAGRDRIDLTEWFCQGTVDNLETNRRVSVVVWDQITDSGLQILGEVESMEEVGILDGFAPEVDDKEVSPQVQRRLVVRVDKVLRFRKAWHSDREE